MYESVDSRLNICAVIVTYNRKQYLEKLLDRLILIDELDEIFVLDNHGNDGTVNMIVKYGFDEIIEDSIVYECNHHNKAMFFYRNNENTGGSGGFQKAIDMAMRREHDFIWIMDDDVLPENDCLKKLLSGMDKNHLVCIPNRTDEKFTDFATIHYSLHNPFVFKMSRRIKVVTCNSLKNELSEIYAMPFEGPLISTEIIKKVGEPDKSYFIFYDDSDYCRRCLKYTNVYMVKTAILHKQIIPNVDADVSWRTYYVYRNCFTFDHKYCKNYLARNLRPWLIYVAQSLYSKYMGNILKARIIKKAYADYKCGIMGKIITPQNFDEEFGVGNHE